MDAFEREVRAIRAEQYLQEKRAAVEPPRPLSGEELAADPELYKVAEAVCPESPFLFYRRKLGGAVKTAEPPPPKGVSVSEWDEMLSGEKQKKEQA